MAAITKSYTVDITVTDDAEFESFDEKEQEYTTRALLGGVFHHLNSRGFRNGRNIRLKLRPSEDKETQDVVDLLELGLLVRGAV